MSNTGEAGPRGESVRSDCWVEVELGDSGELQLNITSKVEAMYGRQVRALATEALATLGVEHGKVTIEDQGALDWVLAARIECAVRRAGHSPTQPFLLTPRPGFDTPSERERMRRSRLYLPGNGPKLMINAGLYGGDGLILDLEDSVAPVHKDAARLLVRNALRQLDFGGAERMVRINQGELGYLDLDVILPHNVHCVLIPKVEEAEQVRSVEAHISLTLGADHKVLLMPIIESAKGAWNAMEIGQASDAVVALAVGLEDYTADIGAQRTLEGRESFWARSQVVNGARAAGVQPIDTVFSDVADMEGLRASVEEAKGLGFEGKGCIHPRQIKVVHQAMAPTAQEIDKATRIVRAFDDAERKGLGVVSLGSKMIDPPVVKRALRDVTMAEAVGLLEQGWREAPSA